MAYVFNPTYVHQTVAAASKQVITAERWNELFNLLITQGDNTVDAIEAFLTDLNTDGADNVGAVYNSVQMDLQSVLNLISAAIAARYTSTEVNTAITVAKNGCVTSVTYDGAQGKFTINKGDGTNTVIDTTIEKIPASLALVNDAGTTYLVVTNTDGSTTRANVSSLVDSYTFNGSACVSVTASGSGNTRTFTFSVPDGSITNAKLAAEVMSTIIGYKDAAATSASAAASSASTATTKASDAATSASAAATSATNASNSASTATTKATAANTSATNAANSATAAAGSASAAATSATTASNAATSANNSKTAAATSETNAASSATTATTKATNASDSATAAANSAAAAATSASDSASAATTAANNAVADAVTTITTQATNAANSATAAATSATNAATSEQNAASAATTAVAAHNTNLLHKQAQGITQTGTLANAEGENTTASGAQAHAEGNQTTASNTAAHAEGATTVASGYGAHSEGYGCSASDSAAHAEGFQTKAIGEAAHTEGKNTATVTVNTYMVSAKVDNTHFTLNTVDGLSATTKLDYFNSPGFLRGTCTVASIAGNTICTAETITATVFAFKKFGTSGGVAAHAEGKDTTASGEAAHAEGLTTKATDEAAHAEGCDTVASGFEAHAEGYGTVASGYGSHAQNESTIAQGFAQTVIGCGNIAQGNPISIAPNDYSFIIGNAAYDSEAGTIAARSNAMTVTWAGDLWIAGNYHSADGSAGVTGSFTSQDGKTVTVKNGIITSIA